MWFGTQEKERHRSTCAGRPHRAVHSSHPRSKSHAGCRPGRPLRRRYQATHTGRQEEHGSLPGGLHVQADETRIRRFEITICDLKPGRQAVFTLISSGFRNRFLLGRDWSTALVGKRSILVRDSTEQFDKLLKINRRLMHRKVLKNNDFDGNISPGRSDKEGMTYLA